MNRRYQRIRALLSPQMQRCRSRSTREKVELIYLALRIDDAKEACARRGVSRTFYYKWFKRLRRAKYDIQALTEESRRPKRSPKMLEARLEARIRHFRRQGLGADLISVMMLKEGNKVSPQTVCHILNGRKKVKRTRREKKLMHRRRYEIPIPGERLQMDVKYVPQLVGGKRVYAYVAVDECTRWRFARAYSELNCFMTADFLDRLKQACPFPIKAIQTDNGHEFTFRLSPGESRPHPMDLWCQREGIDHPCIPPGEKELNGKVERSHRIDEQYFYWRAPTDNLMNFNYRLKCWLDTYNKHRPHKGLHWLTPAEKLTERIETLQMQSAIEIWELNKQFPDSEIKLAEPTMTERLLHELDLELAIYNQMSQGAVLPMSL